MSHKDLIFLHKHLKPVTQALGYSELSQGLSAVNHVTQQLYDGELNPEDLMAFLKEDPRRFCALLNVYPIQDAYKAVEVFRRLAAPTQLDISTLSELKAWVRQENVGINAHFENFEGNHPFSLDFSIKQIDVSTYQLMIDIVTPAPKAGEVLWDRKVIETADPELMMMGIVRESKNLAEIFYTDNLYSPVTPIDNPMARYHPERAKVTREFIKNGLITSSSFMGADNGKGQSAIVREMTNLLADFPLKNRIHENSGNTSFLTRNKLQLSYYPQ